jgi:amino acid adenylation domain-containing protein
VRVDELLEARASEMPRKIALICGEERHTYAELDERARRFARLLYDGGILPGDRVAICLENSADAVIALFGVLKANAVFFIVNPQARLEYRNQLIRDSGAAAVVERDAAGKPFITRITNPRRGGPFATDIDPDLAALVYTSGSSGTPKGVMLTHRNLTFAAESICTYLQNTADDVILSVLPLSFTYGLGQVTTAFYAGATLMLERSFTYPRAVLDTMRRERVTGFPIVPTIATLLLQQDLRMHRLPHLRYITNAAAALPLATMRRLRTAFPRTDIFLMYGQTECQRVSYLPPGLIDQCPGSVGVPIPGTSVQVVDEDGRPVGPGIVGELVVRGPHVMKGYWNDPAATAKVLRPDGDSGDALLQTGDLFRMGPNRLLYFVERRDDVIKVRGEKVAPRQIEEVIARLAGVAEVSVYGVPDEIAGEAIAASVTPCDGTQLSADQIRRHCLEHLEPYMVPKLVDVRAALPTTASGKVSRRDLRLLTVSRGASVA